MCVLVAFSSDVTSLRALFGVVLTTTGLAVLTKSQNYFSVQYGLLCLITMGTFTSGVFIVCWYVMNLHGHIERSIGIA